MKRCKVFCRTKGESQSVRQRWMDKTRSLRKPMFKIPASSFFDLFFRLGVTLLCLALCTSLCGATQKTLDQTAKDAQNSLHTMAGISQREGLLAQRELLPPGQNTSDWAAMVCALQNAPEDYQTYLQVLEQQVTARCAATGGLDGGKATEWHRIALTVLALGGDPTAFGQDGQGEPINLVAQGVYDYGPGRLDDQGLNGLLYALLTLDAKDYEVPAGSRYTRESILEAILAQQNQDGGFGLIQGTSDTDVTAMALQALAPYRETVAKEAVEKSLAYLADVENDDGTFLSIYGDPSLESSAQVVIALCSLGIDPDGAQLRQGDTSALDGLLRYQQEDGSFAHTVGAKGDFLATEQALLAITAAQRFYAGQSGIYDFTNYTPPESRGSSQTAFFAWGIGGGALCVLLLVLWRKGRKESKR